MYVAPLSMTLGGKVKWLKVLDTKGQLKQKALITDLHEQYCLLKQFCSHKKDYRYLMIFNKNFVLLMENMFDI